MLIFTVLISTVQQSDTVLYIYIYIHILFHDFLKGIEFVIILFLFYVLIFWPQGIWDLGSPTRDQTHAPHIDEVLTTGPPGKSLHYGLSQDIECSSQDYTVRPCLFCVIVCIC